MDADACIAWMENHLELLAKYDKVKYKPVQVEKPLREQVWAQVPATQRIAQQVAGLGKAMYPDTVSDGRLILDAVEAACHIVIGKLKTDQEITAMLGTSAPRLSADRLHPWVWDAAKSLWETKHYRQAVQNAATSLVAHLENLVSVRTLADKDLLIQLFRSDPPTAKRPRLVWPGDPEDLTVKSMRDGLRQFSAGVIMTVRNPATHETDEYEEHEALERLATLSLLARWIEACELIHEVDQSDA